MGFLKGEAWNGNRKGRPRVKQSLAEVIRSRFNARKRRKAVDNVIAVAMNDELPKDAIAALITLAKLGWPEGAFTGEEMRPLIITTFGATRTRARLSPSRCPRRQHRPRSRRPCQRTTRG